MALRQQLQLLVLLLFAGLAAPEKLLDDCGAAHMQCYIIDSVSTTGTAQYITQEPADQSTLEGFRLDTKDFAATEWKLLLKLNGQLADCVFSIGHLKFPCLKDDLATKTIDGVEITHTTSPEGFQVYQFKVNPPDPTLSLADAARLYLDSIQIMKLSGQVGGTFVELVTDGAKEIHYYYLSYVPQLRKEKPYPAAQEALNLQNSYLRNEAKFSCPSTPRTNQIFFGIMPTSAFAVYWTDKGWRDVDGNILYQEDPASIPYCWQNLAALKLFERCDEWTKCFVQNEPDKPLTELTSRGDDTLNKGVCLDMNDDFVWTMTIGWPAKHDDCEVQLAFKSNIFIIPCDPVINHEFEMIGIKVKKVEAGKDKTVNQAKFTISVSGKEPIFDKLKLYAESEVKVKMTSVSGMNSEAETAFGFACSVSTIGMLNTAEPVAPLVNNLFTCSDPHNKLIFLNEVNTDKEKVYCSKRGWRDINHVYFADAKDPDSVFCYTDNPPKPLPMFVGCGDAKKECLIFDDNTPTDLVKSTADMDSLKLGVLGVVLDTSNDKEWIVILAREQNSATCKFSIGSELTFNCGAQGDLPQTLGEVDVKQIEKGENRKDKSLLYEKYSIKASTDPTENPVVDALQLYMKPAQQVILEDGGKTSKSAAITFFQACVQTSITDSKPAVVAVLPSFDNNKHTCAGKFDIVFLGIVSTHKSEVYCSQRGWRDGTHKYIVVDKDAKAFCYSDLPPVLQNMFSNCDVMDCYDEVANKVTAPPTQGTLGVVLNRNDKSKWIVTIARKDLTGCKFYIGPVVFDCGKTIGDKQTVESVIVEMTNGDKKGITYEEYTITAVDSNDPVVDALKLYKEPSYTLKLEGTGKSLESGRIEFIKKCALPSPAESPSQKAQIADRTHNTFSCGTPPLTDIYLNKVHYGIGPLFFSERGWRKADHTFIGNDNKSPYCYTAKPSSAMPLFLRCDGSTLTRSCFALPDVLVTTTPATNPYELEAKSRQALMKYENGLGLDLEHSNDANWTLIIAYEMHDFVSFQIGDLPAVLFEGKQVNDEVTAYNVVFKYEEQGQDGTVFFGKFSISSTNGEPLIDNLNLYEKEKYSMKLNFKQSITYTANGIQFFKKCDLAFSSHSLPDSEPATPTHNKFECKDAAKNSIFLINQFVGGKEIFCSKKGWRKADGTIVKDHVGSSVEMAFCHNLCAATFVTVTDAFGVKPILDTTTPSPEYKCDSGKASVKIPNVASASGFYGVVKCNDNKWTADSISFEPSKLNGYKVEMTCFGSFLFAKDNCITTDEKKSGCDQPTNINEVIKCKVGYALTYGDKIHKTLTVVNGVWKDDANKYHGPATLGNKPMCLSKCMEAHVTTLAQGDLITQASYIWTQAGNTGVLKCGDPTDILFADLPLEGSEKAYYEEWNCDPKTEWKSGTLQRPLTTITDPAKFKVTAHCFQACDPSKVTNACNGDSKCKDFIYNAQKLSCPANHVLIVNSNEMSKPLACTNKGWIEEGKTSILNGLNHEADKNIKLSVQCLENCNKKFREGSAKYDETSNTMTCDGTNIIEYKYGNSAASKILDDLQCVNTEGWKIPGISAPLVPFEMDSGKLKKFDAKCVPSCTDALINSDCSTRKNCQKPQLLPTTDLIKCKTPKSHVLYERTQNKLEYKEIRCQKKSFETESKAIDMPRSRPDMKIEVDCISRCDKQFVTIDVSATTIISKPNTLTQKDDGTNIECPDPLHYTILNTGSQQYYTAKKFECDQEKGWSAVDILVADVGKYFFKFDETTHLDKATTGCLNICLKRYDDKCPTAKPDNCGPVIFYTSANELNCDNSYTMRIGDNDFIRKKFQCVKDGYRIKSVTPDEFIFKFDNMKPAEKFDVECINNCNEQFVTLLKDDTANLIVKAELSNKKLSCKNDILIIEKASASSSGPPIITRVFGEATCAAALGWSGATAKVDPVSKVVTTAPTKIVDFAKEVKLTASCKTACSSALLEDGFTAGETNSKSATYDMDRNLFCNDPYRLFLKHGDKNEVETDSVKCSREGWMAGTNVVIDFRNPQVEITDKVHHICRHKCHRIFVQSLCAPDDKTCSEFIYDDTESGVDAKLRCAHESEILVIEYEGVTKESFTNATCSSVGWKHTDASKSSIFDFVKPNYHIKAKCVQVCHPDTLIGTQAEKSSLQYNLGERLTCTKVDEMLVFDGKAWYTDMMCSKEGWKSMNPLDLDPKADTKKIDFTAGTLPVGTPHKTKTYKAECKHSECYRTQEWGTGVTDPCVATEKVNGTDAQIVVDECRPDWIKTKYSMTCKDPARIERNKGSIVHPILRCESENWVTVPGGEVFISKNDNFDAVCKAADCAKCGDDLKDNILECSGTNCAEIKFYPGTSHFCSRYKCALGYSYVESNVDNEKSYYFNDGDAAIKCKSGTTDEYETPDGGRSISRKIGCVKWIPCIEHSPILTDCISDKVKCDVDVLKQKLVEGSKEAKTAVTCNPGMTLYHMSGDNKWTSLAKLQCRKDGRWNVFSKETPTEAEKEPLKRINHDAERVVCASADPTIPPPPPPTTTTQKPPACNYCPDIARLDCDGCSKEVGAITTKSEGDKCIAIPRDGWRIVTNDGDETKELTCEKSKENGNYEWKSKEGKIVSKASSRVSIADKVHVGMIVGITVGVLVVLLLVGAAIGYVIYRRKQELLRLETLKSKGLEQKNDTIIENLSVEDPKTIML